MLLTLVLCLRLAWSAAPTPIAISPPQLTDLSSLHPLAPTRLNTTILGAEVGCFPFRPSTDSPLRRANKHDCELAMDNWVRGHRLGTPRRFGRNPSSATDDVLLPTSFTSGSCFVQLDMMKEDDEVTLTLAEIYAEVMGPDGVAKQCLGPGSVPGLGGRMTLGPQGLLRVVVTGRR